MNQRRSIRLNPFEHETLARLYLARRIATDRYMHRPNELRDLTADFNGLTGREDTPQEILHYMQTKRRSKNQWPKLNGTHIRLPLVLGRLVEPEHVEVLCRLYAEFECGPETFVQDRDMAVRLERRFEQATGIRKRGYVLATAMIELRKDGLLPKHGRRRRGFDDFDAAESMSG